MVQLYVDGERIASWAEGESKLAEYAALGKEIEVRDEAGTTMGRIVPCGPLCPWDPTLTKEKMDEISKRGGGVSLKELLKRIGAE